MISKRAFVYASSLFNVSSEAETLNQLQIASVLLKEKSVFNFFSSPSIEFKEKKHLLAEAFKDSPPFFKNFLFLLVERKLLSLFSEMQEAFQNLLNQKQNKVQGEIFSVRKLDSKEKEDLKKSLASFFKKEITLQENQDPSLVGGLYVRAGEYVFNDTLSFHLKNFKVKGE